MPSRLDIESLSPHLFWDTHPGRIDIDKHASWLVKRVLEYGDWPDWQALTQYYGKPRLASIATSIRSLHPKAFAFCQAWFGLPEQSFRCSIKQPSL